MPRKASDKEVANNLKNLPASWLKKTLTAESSWNDKDDFLDAIYWLRQVLSLVFGILWGFLLVQGFIGLVTFLLTNCFLVYLYTTTFQNVDEEDYGGMVEILKEGMMSSFATFLVSWIIVYSAKLESIDLPV
ncbi:GEL complex subunit OPTI-like [Watersipora subatra]|uniref:GEL complex subunit OPTI-like n=1 Tax=Watersipora subatra TaxID=2589382 RepID=UPI00355B8642